MVFVFLCLFSARVKDQILWKLVTLICEKVVSFTFAIWFQHIAQQWSYLEQIGRGPFFEALNTFLPDVSVKCVLPLGWLHLGVLIHIM